MVILWYYNGIIIEGETTLLVFFHCIRSILKRTRKIPHGQGNSLVVWEKLISDIKLCKAKNSNRISLNGLLFLLVSTFYLTFQNRSQLKFLYLHPILLLYNLLR